MVKGCRPLLLNQQSMLSLEKVLHKTTDALVKTRCTLLTSTPYSHSEWHTQENVRNMVSGDDGGRWRITGE